MYIEISKAHHYIVKTFESSERLDLGTDSCRVEHHRTEYTSRVC